MHYMRTKTLAPFLVYAIYNNNRRKKLGLGQMSLCVEPLSRSTDTIFIINSIRLQPPDKVIDLEFVKN